MARFNPPSEQQKKIDAFQLVVQLLKAATAKKLKNKANPLSPCPNTKYSQQGNIQLLQPEQLIVLLTVS